MKFRLDHDEREQYYYLVLIDKYNIVFEMMKPLQKLLAFHYHSIGQNYHNLIVLKNMI